MAEAKRTATSYAHVQTDLPGDPFAAKLREARLARTFTANVYPMKEAQIRDLTLTEAERRNETARGSEMVRNDKPHPAPRPSWADGPDKAAFNGRWNRERSKAQIGQLYEARGHMIQTRRDIDRLADTVPEIDAKEARGDVKGAKRDIDGGHRSLRSMTRTLKPHVETKRKIERDR